MFAATLSRRVRAYLRRSAGDRHVTARGDGQPQSRLARRRVARSLVGGRDPVEARERPAQDPRDLHLTDSDALADLRLREIAFEAKAQDVALAGREGPHE